MKISITINFLENIYSKNVNLDYKQRPSSLQIVNWWQDGRELWNITAWV